MARYAVALLALAALGCGSDLSPSPFPDVRGVYEYGAPPVQVWPDLPLVVHTTGTVTIGSQEPDGAITGTFGVLLTIGTFAVQREGTLAGTVQEDGRVSFRFIEGEYRPEDDPNWAHEGLWSDGRIDGTYSRGPGEPVTGTFWAMRQ